MGPQPQPKTVGDLSSEGSNRAKLEDVSDARVCGDRDGRATQSPSVHTPGKDSTIIKVSDAIWGRPVMWIWAE